MARLLKMTLMLAVAGGGVAAVSGCHDDHRGRDHMYVVPERDHYRHNDRDRYYHEGDRHEEHHDHD